MNYRTALVTGASSGIGRGLALALAARGTHVVCAARRRAELDALTCEIAGQGGSGETLVLDVSDPDATYEAVRSLDGRRPLDLVVANAGVAGPTRAQDLEWPKVRHMLDVNLTGACATLCGALPGMIERGAGHLVGVASLAALRGLPSRATYSASKAGLRTFLEGLRLDLHGSHVYVTTLLPGFIKTPMTAHHRTLPFVLECDEAVKIIVRAIDDKVAEHAFPWPMSAALRASRALVPDALLIAVNRRSKF